MKVFVISLPGDEARREFMRGQLGAFGLDFEFFDAVRGSERIHDPVWYDDAAARKLEDRSLRAGEVGCALSHAAVYAEIARRDLPWALILEDDAILHPELPAVLRALEAGSIEKGDMIFLERCDHYRPGTARPLAGEFRLVDPVLVRHGNNAQSAGYIVSGTAAKAIRGVNVPVKFPADNWGYYRQFVRFRGVVPTLTLIRQRVDLGSTITATGERRAFRPYSVFDLLWNSFKAYTPLGRALKHGAKHLLGRE